MNLATRKHLSSLWYTSKSECAISCAPKKVRSHQAAELAQLSRRSEQVTTLRSAVCDGQAQRSATCWPHQFEPRKQALQDSSQTCLRRHQSNRRKPSDVCCKGDAADACTKFGGSAITAHAKHTPHWESTAQWRFCNPAGGCVH
jgi:hypothetical protein